MKKKALGQGLPGDYPTRSTDGSPLTCIFKRNLPLQNDGKSGLQTATTCARALPLFYFRDIFIFKRARTQSSTGLQQ